MIALERLFVVVDYSGQEFGCDFDDDHLPQLCIDLDNPIIIGEVDPNENGGCCHDRSDDAEARK